MIKAHPFSSPEYVFEEVDVGGVKLWQVSLAFLSEELVKFILTLEPLLEVVDVHTLKLAHSLFMLPLILIGNKIC
jgi:hypothetical protein